jgi:hypothetical protein
MVLAQLERAEHAAVKICSRIPFKVFVLGLLKGAFPRSLEKLVSGRSLDHQEAMPSSRDRIIRRKPGVGGSQPEAPPRSHLVLLDQLKLIVHPQVLPSTKIQLPDKSQP